MFVQPIRPDVAVRPVPVDVGDEEPRVAVLLNANARQVNARIRRVLSHVVPDGDLFLSRSFEEARAMSETVVDRRYGIVFTGGGDGTFVGFLNEIHNVIERRRASSPFAAPRPPIFGVLRLGTGNAIANLVGASPLKGDAVVDDVLRARADEVPAVRKLQLLVAEGKRAPFAGVGLDAGILNHYVETKHTFGRGVLSGILAGGVGYAAAVAGRSLPHYLSHARPSIEIRSRGVAYRVGLDGRAIGNPMGPGAVLYRGPALMAAAGTIPCYGYNLRLFPFANARRGMMHLRVVNIPIAQAVANLYPGLWNGTWFHDELHDFLVEDVDVEVDRKVPVQIGGDAEGYRDHVRLSMWKSSVEVLDFAPSRKA